MIGWEIAYRSSILADVIERHGMDNNRSLQNELKRSLEQVQQLQDDWKKNDPDYEVIMSYLVPHMEDIGRSFPHEMWPQMTFISYKLLKGVLKDNGLSKELKVSHMQSTTLH